MMYGPIGSGARATEEVHVDGAPPCTGTRSPVMTTHSPRSTRSRSANAVVGSSAVTCTELDIRRACEPQNAVEVVSVLRV